ncbi:MAG: DNA translocase FtsK 4TM domain-containing protein [Mariprofundaceae bacterium]|nr:DNA translocase FtsK 4TM domain-containing protein [Mariprofundaceae bacterium]
MNSRALVRESVALLLVAVTITLAIALYSFSPQDPSFNHEVSSRIVLNKVGLVGSYTADFLYQLFGFGAWIWLLLYFAVAVRMARGKRPWMGGWTSLFWLPVVLGLCALADAHQAWFPAFTRTFPAGVGGALGGMIATGLHQPLHAIGSDVLLLALVVSSFVAASHISLVHLFRQTISLFVACISLIMQQIIRQTNRARFILTGRKERMVAREQRQEAKKVKVARKLKSGPQVGKQARAEVSRRAHEEQQGELALKEPSREGFKLPAVSLFTSPRGGKRAHNEQSLQAMARMLEKKLLDYHIEGEVVAVQPGPVVIQFEFEPAPGTKVSRIVTLQNDLARAMSAVSVRVAGNIPGKRVIGIEIPNEEREMVYMHDVLASQEFSGKKHVLPLALGVDIAGRPVVTDLVKMPHLLIAGTTGSGKSVAVNSMICSMLMTHTPADLRLIMVDPKMLELSMYDDIPHLLAPVVTNPHKAARALAWAVYEMERRYRLMSEARVRNIDGYNKAVHKKGDSLLSSERKSETIPFFAERLPYVVIVIDELADLMMVAGKEVEQSICRLAQKARASGLHLILATQRPSVDVITGLIKANLPSRISFQVSSRVDSRTILDQMGAEQLLGQGDSLFLSSGHTLQRIHGAFVSDAEVMGLVEHLKSQGEPEYREDVFEVADGDQKDAGGNDETDARYDEAADLVIQKGQCSVSMVQRYLRVGYNRASRIVEQMEHEGLVTPPGSGGMRKVLAKSLEDGGGGAE